MKEYVFKANMYEKIIMSACNELIFFFWRVITICVYLAIYFIILSHSHSAFFFEIKEMYIEMKAITKSYTLNLHSAKKNYNIVSTSADRA
jgi:hypothetical protein